MYSFGIPKWIIHSIHILAGLFLLNAGRNLRAGSPLPALSKQLLAGLGLMSALYQAFLWFRDGGQGTYAYNVPTWVIHLFHILNGLILLSFGTNLIPARFRLSADNRSLYLIITGALATLYHLHLMLF